MRAKIYKRQSRVKVESREMQLQPDYSCVEDVNFFSNEWAMIVPLFGRHNAGKYKVFFQYRKSFPDDIVMHDAGEIFKSISPKIEDKINRKLIFYMEKVE